MGIEKYFQTKGGGSSKPIKKAEPEKKTTTRKAKATAKEEEDFQEPVTKSKFFGSSEKKVDPKSFFGSKKSAETQPEAAVKKETVPAKKDEIIDKKEKAPTKKETVAAKKETVAAKKETAAAKKETAAAKKSKAPIKRVTEEKELAPRKRKPIVISDDEDYNDDEDEYEEETIPANKKLKRADSYVAATDKKSTTAIKKETKDEQEETPKKKNNYFAMMKNKEGPKALGSRPEPVGASNCLADKIFVISGQYETLTRDQTKTIVMRYGGKVTSAVSGKTNYLLLGRDAGESKTAKAKSLGTGILDEDAFYNLVESSAPQKVEYAPPPKPAKGKESDTVNNIPLKDGPATQTWTEKYKPTSVKEILGNKETVKKIDEWLANWQTNYSKGFEGEGDDMTNWRSILLSGPPGIGKTTTAGVVARNNGYEPLEFNASDVRSKKVLEASISEMIDNRTMTEYFQPKTESAKAIQPKILQGKKVVLIMDEVDGMSGGDRGGAAELASLIRKSKIPVICICNDSRSPKVAPLLKVCYEAKYRRTPAAQIRSRILSIAYREKLKITPNAVDELVQATHNDIRQIINILSTYRLNQDAMDFDQAKKVGKTNQKSSVLGLFEIPGELLSADAWRSKTLNEKANIYFHDYSLAHLIIFENYLKCKPERARARSGNPIEEACNEMDLIAKAADAMADGDVVDSLIHGSVQQYSLMPVHSMFSCVRPASFMRGAITSRIMFPSWLGQNSKAGKYARALADIQTRMRLRASGDKYEIRQNYIPTLNSRIFGELLKENLDETMDYMDHYYLDRENLDILSELTFLAPKEKAPFASLPTKVKTAFTRQYNSKNHPILFQLSGNPIKKVASGPKEDIESTVVAEDDSAYVEEEELDKADDPELDIQNIKYIKESTKKRKNTATASGSSKKLKSKK